MSRSASWQASHIRAGAPRRQVPPNKTTTPPQTPPTLSNSTLSASLDPSAAQIPPSTRILQSTSHLHSQILFPSPFSDPFSTSNFCCCPPLRLSSSRAHKHLRREQTADGLESSPTKHSDPSRTFAQRWIQAARGLCAFHELS